MSFLFTDTATTEIYTLSLHDALPISWRFGTLRGFPQNHYTRRGTMGFLGYFNGFGGRDMAVDLGTEARSEEHTSELQSLTNLVCRLLLEKKKKKSRLHTK